MNNNNNSAFIVTVLLLVDRYIMPVLYAHHVPIIRYDILGEIKEANYSSDCVDHNKSFSVNKIRKFSSIFS